MIINPLIGIYDRIVGNPQWWWDDHKPPVLGWSWTSSSDTQFFDPCVPNGAPQNLDVDRFPIKMVFVSKKDIQLFFELVYPDLRHVVIVSHRIIGTVTKFWGEPVTILLWWHFKNVMCPVTWILVWSVHKLSNAQCQGRLSLEISRRCCPISQDAWLDHIWMVTSILYLCTCLFRCTKPIY